MTKTKTYRFTQAMTENIKWLTDEFNTTETEILEILITYATSKHDDFVNDEIKKPDIEKYMEMQIYGINKEQH